MAININHARDLNEIREFLAQCVDYERTLPGIRMKLSRLIQSINDKIVNGDDALACEDENTRPTIPVVNPDELQPVLSFPPPVVIPRSPLPKLESIGFFGNDIGDIDVELEP